MALSKLNKENKTKSQFNLNKIKYNGININELRTMAENQLYLDKLDYSVISKKDLLRKLKKHMKQNKKAENIYKKIEKLKSKLAKLRGIEL